MLGFGRKQVYKVLVGNLAECWGQVGNKFIMFLVGN